MKLRLKVLLCFMVLATAASAQNWGGGVDDEPIHFGFTFQYISSEHKILKKANWQEPFMEEGGLKGLPLGSISSTPSAGFGIGFVVNKRLGENADIRFTPTLAFSDSSVDYGYPSSIDDSGITDDPTSEIVNKKIQSTFVEFPLGVKLKSNRRNNYRAYVLAGAKYAVDISKKTKNTSITDPMEKFLNNKRSFISYEGGFGLDLYFEYFKMSPEIKLSYSVNSVLEAEKHRYSAPIDKLMLRHVTFSLFFE